MQCAAKEDTIHFVVYTGLHLDYPEWFVDFIRDGYVSDDHSSHIYASTDGDIAIAMGDVFLMNNRRDIQYLTQMQFRKYYNVIGGI
ncbi:MAG: hypothetical protein RR643_04900 [Anaerorhabdus sp.]|uniref:hypothetical protein n=1 Tax=Anaerorhabdus sp. TaxID=1872524 RepID=UPI002FCB5F3B